MPLIMRAEPVCASCGIVIRWQPTIVDGEVYCCLGCAQGGPCECDYDNLPQPDGHTAMVLQKAQDTGELSDVGVSEVSQEPEQ